MSVRITCAGDCSRPLNWDAKDESHAHNLLAKHNREHHDGTTPAGLDGSASPAGPAAYVGTLLHLTESARTVLDLDHAAAYAVWCTLTGLNPTDAKTYAVSLAEDDHTVTAHIAPF